MNKYKLQQSATRSGWWIVTDTENGIVCEFEEHRFNATQRYTFLNDVRQIPEPAELAKIPNGIADWLATFHYDLAMGDATEIEPAETRGADGIQIGAYIFPVQMTTRLRIGRQIAYYRKRACLTIRELAELSGVTAQNITKIENGRYNVSVGILGKLCKALGVELRLIDREDIWDEGDE